MAFEIADLMIQVVTDGAHAAAKDQPTHCLPNVTCKQQSEKTACQVSSTCKPDTTKTSCQEHVTCLRSEQATASESELDALLAQLRATLIAETTSG